MTTKQCGTCRWHVHESISDGYICYNTKSGHVADWTDQDYVCEEWEAPDEVNT